MKILAILLSVAIALSGCATTAEKDSLRESTQRTSDMLKLAEESQAKMDSSASGATLSEIPWIGSKLMERHKGALPAAFMGRITLALDREKGERVPLSVAASEITRVTGIPVRISADVLVQNGLNPSATSQPPVQQAAGPALQTPAVQPSYQAWGSFVDLDFTDVALSDLLDQISARMGISWEYHPEDGAIYFNRYVTRTYLLHILPGATTQQASVGKTGSSGVGFSATSSSAISTNVDTWLTIETEIKAMMTDKGKLAVSPSTQTVTVTDVRATMDRVAEYVARINHLMTKQISIKVDVVSVALSKGSEMGVNWSAVYNNLSKVAPNMKFGVTSMGPTGAGLGGSMAMSVLTPVGGAASNWDGSTAMLQALQSAGRTSVLDTRRIATLNNQPAPIAVTSQLSYISGYTAGTAATATSVASPATPITALLTTGYLLNIYPSILDDRELLLQFSVDISSLVNMASVTTTVGTIQQPEVSSTQFLQRARVKMGETVVLSGYARKGNQHSQKGTFAPDNYAMGGGYAGSDTTDELVIMITPIISE